MSKTLFQTGVDGNEPVDVPPALRGPIPVPLPGRLRHAEAVAVKTLPSLASGGPPGVEVDTPFIYTVYHAFPVSLRFHLFILDFGV